MNWEIERQDWSSLRAEGGAMGVPAAIMALQVATSEDEALAAYWRIDNTVVVQGSVYEAALAVIPCLLCSLLRCTHIARPHVLELLAQIGAGEPAQVELEAGNLSLITDCVHEISRGLAILVNILEHTDDPDERAYCVDLLGLCCRVNESLRERVSWYFDALRARADLSAGLLQLLQSWLEEVDPPDAMDAKPRT